MRPRAWAWTALAAAALAAYAALGFWGLPWLLKWQLPELAAQQLGRKASVQAVHFNPFTLRLQVRDLQLQEADGQALLALEELRVRLLWRSLWLARWQLEELHLGTPRVQLVIAADGQLNLQALAERLRGGDSQPAGGGLPRLVIERLSLSQGRVDVDDRRAGWQGHIGAIEAQIRPLSTLAQGTGEHLITATAGAGGQLHWQGELALNPVQASGTLTLENLALPAFQAYLRPWTSTQLRSGRLQLALPYRVSQSDGTWQAGVQDARLALQQLDLGQAGQAQPFAVLQGIRADGLGADLSQRTLSLSSLSIEGGHVHVRRNAQGELDLAALLTPALAPSAASSPSVSSVPPAASPPSVASGIPARSAGSATGADAPRPWQLAAQTVRVEKLALRVTDDTVQPPVSLQTAQAGLQVQVQATVGPGAPALQLRDGALSLEGLAVSQAGRMPVQLDRLVVRDIQLDLARRKLDIGQLLAQQGRLQLIRTAQGLDLLALLPKAGDSAANAQAVAPAWSAQLRQLQLQNWNAALQDRPSGIGLRLQDIALQLKGLSTDRRQGVDFEAALRLHSGGQLVARGRALGPQVDARLQAEQLALAPLQPLLARYLRLQLTEGTLQARGQLQVRPGAGGAAAVRFDGGAQLDGLKLQEDDGSPFLSFAQLAAPALSLGLSPGSLHIPELRISQPRAIFILESDRSLNAARLLVQRPQPGPSAAATAPTHPAATSATAGTQAPSTRPAGGAATGSQPTQTGTAASPAASVGQDRESFPVRVARVRVEDAQLFFEDRSLRPQFGTDIHALSGIITGLSSQREGRSQVELDGQVGEFGLARVRGELNPFVPRDNTDLMLSFRNIEMVPATPYAMKFAGYRIAQGKMSLDLRYTVRDSQLQGQNRIVLDQLTLGEKVDSPDALKLPLELALAILRDSDGRIDLDLPVTGDLNDPQFSYGAIIWKAITNVLTKIVTAPFRALGALLGLSSDKLEALVFDPGSAQLLPPEREKLAQVSQMLAQRPQLRLTLSSPWHEAADGAALRASALREEVARRSGQPLQAGQTPGPLDLSDDQVRTALRALFAQRLSPAALASALQSGDERQAHTQMRQRLEETQPLAPEALQQLGAQRAQAVSQALQALGVAAERLSLKPATALDEDVQGAVPMTLELDLAR